jgi:hypothetical protein
MSRLLAARHRGHTLPELEFARPESHIGASCAATVLSVSGTSLSTTANHRTYVRWEAGLGERMRRVRACAAGPSFDLRFPVQFGAP